jgi:RNA polymerase sigma-70 factor (ECF subfamily)
MNDVETRELLLRIQEGDEPAFLEVYNRWSKPLFQFSWQMTGSTSSAEDITQEIFLLLIRKKLNFDPAKGSFSSFIYGVARNLSLKAARKERQFLGLFQGAGDTNREQPGIQNPLFQLANTEAATMIRKCILSLPPQYREVVILCDLQEMSYAEAAEITGSAIGTVRSRLHRGRDLLSQKLGARGRSDQKSSTGGTPYEIPAL